MSESQTAVPIPSTKRPLEELSSPSGPADQPEAKRPALDKIIKNVKNDSEGQPPGLEAPIVSSTIDETTNGTKIEESEAQNDGASTDIGNKSVQITAAVARDGQHQGTNLQHDESGWLHIRAVITSAEAATVIGKGGENVSMIRKMSGAKCTVSDYQKGAVERILTVSGVVDAVAKAFGLIIRTLNNEPLDSASSAQSTTYPLRLLIPHILIGSIIGKGGVRIREIQEASGARLNASDSTLPLSTERSLVVLGVADAVHIATYYVGSTLFEQLTERFGGPASSAYASRSGGPAGVVPGGMQVVPYVPHPAGGNYGHPDNRRHSDRGLHTPGHGSYAQPYSVSHAPRQPAAPLHYGGSPIVAGYSGVGPQQPQHPQNPGPQAHGGPPAQPMPGIVPGQPLTQQIFIPNDMVGAIIGKGGAKINEIRQLSGSVIKINEPQDNSNERLVTITGTAECNQMALYMLYSRLESEKHRI
ncbi:RNA-binding protein rnc1 [Golovinomyces cichoracearum]|uniref:RNA-binding protein rnc1 n=1 Tax=Golovinomyces cichoracearum TaxID=62708 RepID=A0A420J3C2_9PEZI|nr:RNA-binding protein rnc1 [Golovinomyces cichoracearum]